MRGINSPILWDDIRESLRSRRSRTALSLGALSLGMICLSMLAAILEGLNQRADQLAAELGAQVIAIHAGDSGALSETQVRTLQDNLPDARVDSLIRHRVLSGSLNQDVQVVATGEQLARIKNWTLSSGRFLDRADLRQKAKHCVISSSLMQQHQLQLGDLLMLERIPFHIVGILGKQGESDAPNLANGLADVYIARSLTPEWSDRKIARGTVDTLYVQWPQPAGFDGALQSIQNILYADAAPRSAHLQFITPDILLAGIHRVQLTLQLTAGTVAVLCLALGGCTLMALMIATVKERVSEIGLRFSLGASRQAIYNLFIGEALCITACAALIGTLGGQVLLLALKPYIDLPFRLTWQTLSLPVLAALLLAGLFAFWPAWQAARIRPADALRCE